MTGTSTSALPPSRSGSSTITVIGPSTSSPGVTTTLPLSSISTGTSLPSSSVAETFVSSSGLLTTMPVSCCSSVGSTGFTPESSTVVGCPTGSGTRSVTSYSLSLWSTKVYVTVTFGLSSSASTSSVGVPVILPVSASKVRPAGRSATAIEPSFTLSLCGWLSKPVGTTSCSYSTLIFAAFSGESVTVNRADTRSCWVSSTSTVSVLMTRSSSGADGSMNSGLPSSSRTGRSSCTMTLMSRVTITSEVPGFVGVPEILPVSGSNVSPSGRPSTL